MFPVTILVDVLGFLDRKELEPVFEANVLLHKIVIRYFSETPLQRYDSISVWWNNESESSIMKVQKSLKVCRDGTVYSPEPEYYAVDPFLNDLASFLELPFIRFDALFLTCDRAENYLSWTNTFRHYPHAFQATKSLVLHFNRDPLWLHFAQLMNCLPLPSVERVEIEFQESLPSVYGCKGSFFDLNVFSIAHSVNIICRKKKKMGLLFNVSDIIQWLHAHNPSNESRTLHISGSFSPLRLSMLLGILSKIFVKATSPCSYLLVLQGYMKPNAYCNLLNPKTGERWTFKGLRHLGCVTVQRQKLQRI